MRAASCILSGDTTKVLKVADFGSARHVPGQESHQFEACGVTGTRGTTAAMTPGPHLVTATYRAPEVFLGAKSYSCAIDAWSVGCVIGEILSGGKLFGLPTMTNDDEILQRIFQKLGNSCAEGIPCELKELPAWPRKTQMLTQARCGAAFFFVSGSVVPTELSHGNAAVRLRGSGSPG